MKFGATLSSIRNCDKEESGHIKAIIEESAGKIYVTHGGVLARGYANGGSMNMEQVAFGRTIERKMRK